MGNRERNKNKRKEKFWRALREERRESTAEKVRKSRRGDKKNRIKQREK